MRWMLGFLCFVLVLISACSGSGASPPQPPPADASSTETSQAFLKNRTPPEGRIAFSADGSIYVVNLDGSGLQKIVDGNNAPQQGRDLFFRQPDWAAAPAFSPDGSQVAFIRDLDVWLVNADGGDLRRLADIADAPPETCAGLSACTPLGPSNLSWSPDGSQIAVMLQRVGGSGMSGLSVIDVSAGDVRRLHGRYVDAGMFMTVRWLPGGSLALSPSAGFVARIDATTGDELASVDLMKAPWPGSVDEASDGTWVAGSFGTDAPIVAGSPGAMSQVATGLSPALSPDGYWVAYYDGETVRVVRTDGTDDRQVLDLAPLGGRDRHAAWCYPDYNDSCSYRPPALSWAAP